jgi:hypothetical protein
MRLPVARHALRGVRGAAVWTAISAAGLALGVHVQQSPGQGHS